MLILMKFCHIRCHRQFSCRIEECKLSACELCFCKGSHWYNKCDTVTDAVIRNPDICRNCQKSKKCFCCTGLHNSKNTMANSNCVLLQTAEIILVNLVNKSKIRVRTLFDQGSQRSHINENVKSFLKLISTGHGNMSISTFGNKTLTKKELKKFYFILKNALINYFTIETLCTEFFCLSLKNQPVEFNKKNDPHLQNLKLGRCSGQQQYRVINSVRVLLGFDNMQFWCNRYLGGFLMGLWIINLFMIQTIN